MIQFWIIIFLMTLAAVCFIAIPLFTNSEKSHTNFWLLLFLLISFPIAAITLYLHWGYSDKLSIQAQIKQIKSPDQVIVLLKQRLQESPNSAKGWFLLGKLYFDMGKFSRAIPALTKANQLKPNNVSIMTVYAEALFFSNHKQLNQKSMSLVKQVLKKQPHNLNSVNLLAVDAYQRKNFKKAVAYWETLLQTVPPESHDGEVLRAMIAKAQRRLT